MPEVGGFQGIVIRMYFDDHNPPHFQAHDSGHDLVIKIRTLSVISGQLPSRALGLVAEWGSIHSDELLELWGRAKNSRRFHRIDPLP